MDEQRLIDGPMDPMGGSTATPKRTGRTDKYGQLAERKDGFADTNVTEYADE